METKFIDQCKTFYSSLLTALSRQIANEPTVFENKSIDEIDAILHQFANLEANKIKPNLPVPLAMTQTAPIPPTKITAVKTKTTEKAPKKVKTFEDYVEHHKNGDPVCAYSSGRGQNPDIVCCEPAVNCQTTSNPLEWRCSKCINRSTGVIAKMMTSKKENNTLPTPLVGIQKLNDKPALPNFPLGPTYNVSKMQHPLPQALSFPVKTAPTLHIDPLINHTVTKCEIDTIMNHNCQNILFPKDLKYRNLALTKDGDKLICIGRVKLENVPHIMETTNVPVTWHSSEHLTQVTTDDAEFLKRYNIGVQYIPTPVPI